MGTKSLLFFNTHTQTTFLPVCRYIQLAKIAKAATRHTHTRTSTNAHGESPQRTALPPSPLNPIYVGNG